MPTTNTDHACCYHDCPRGGIVHLGKNGGDSHWICCLHLDHWNANRARFLADGGGCEMEELGELLEGSAGYSLSATGCGSRMCSDDTLR